MIRTARRAGLVLAAILAASAARADPTSSPTPRPTPEAPLSPLGTIYDEDVDAHLPAHLNDADRAKVRYVMKKIDPSKRQLLRWLGSGDVIIIYVQDNGVTDVAYQNIAISMESNMYYKPDTGDEFPAMGMETYAAPVRLKHVPSGWKPYPYSHAPRSPAKVMDAAIGGQVPAWLSAPEREDVIWWLERAAPDRRGWYRWAHPRQSPPRTEHPVFGFVIFEDDPYNRDGPNVCFPNLALGTRSTQYWCPYYREALVNPGKDLVGTATSTNH